MDNILDFQLSELNDMITSLGEKKFRAGQVFGWLAKGVGSFDEMNNVPKPLREKLSREYRIGLPKVIAVQRSALDGTVKCLFEYGDGEESARIESVLMRYDYGNSICVSSQAGCRMGCRFCASTRGGLVRGLTSGEVLGQVLAMRNLLREDDVTADIRHVVVMGMGEPFDNYDELSRFIRMINDPAGYNLGMRNITVSTCGLVPMIGRFADDFPQVNLAISLHAPDDETRRKTMPIANRYSMDELLTACRIYAESTGRRVTFEYALISGVNDTASHAEKLAGTLKRYLEQQYIHVNLIPLNEVEGTGLRGAARRRAEDFRKLLEERGVQATVRRTLGSDIDAACGQLRSRY